MGGAPLDFSGYNVAVGCVINHDFRFMHKLFTLWQATWNWKHHNFNPTYRLMHKLLHLLVLVSKDAQPESAYCTTQTTCQSLFVMIKSGHFKRKYLLLIQ